MGDHDAHPSREQTADGASDGGDYGRFAENDSEDRAGSESQGLEDADFADALANGHGNGVARNQQDGERDGAKDRHDEELQVPDESQEAECEGLFRFALGLKWRSLKLIVDRLRDTRNLGSAVGLNEEGAHGVALPARN